MTMNKTLNMNDDENLKAQSKIKDAVDYYRFSSGKCFNTIRNLFVVGALVTAGLTIAKANNNNRIITGIFGSSLMALGAATTHRLKLEKETKTIEKTAMRAKPKLFGDVTELETLKKSLKDGCLLGQVIPVTLIGQSLWNVYPTETLLGGAMLVSLEVAKHVVSKSQRKDLEQTLGSCMPTQYRMYKQHTR